MSRYVICYGKFKRNTFLIQVDLIIYLLCFKSDAEIVYGVTDKQLKGKSWRSRSRSASCSSVQTSDSDVDTSASGETRRSMLRKLSIRKVNRMKECRYTALKVIHV